MRASRVLCLFAFVAAGCATQPPHEVRQPAATVIAPNSSSAIAPPIVPCTVRVCRGAATRKLVEAMLATAPKAARCYDWLLVRYPKLVLDAKVKVRVDVDGRVCSAEMSVDGIAPEIPEFSACVNQELSRHTYPPPIGDCIDLTVPYHFSPRDNPPTPREWARKSAMPIAR
jgi:hypothetical protein